jgi:hypothetical protein
MENVNLKQKKVLGQFKPKIYKGRLVPKGLNSRVISINPQNHG